ncbi:MAG: hypothetical protein CSA18_02395 [Deltaproteobacteria bacterium]|nr:MAG: hypothetical protein CSB21_01070 [Deltaproteobacteria bacterium]PIE74977.1 MAG: hypothetical protein CSA18_02395 [Deltaproteobacteria bacterium]
MNILIVQTGFLGDIILSTPVISALKQIYPDSRLFFLTTPAGRQLIDNDTLLEKVLVYDKRGADKGISGIFKISKKLKKYNFQKVYSLHKSYRTSIMLFLSGINERTGFKKAKFSFLYHKKQSRNPLDHDAVRNLSILGSESDISAFNQELRLFPPDIDEIGEDLKKIKEEKYIFMSPGSAWKTKRWHEKGYNETAKYFENSGYKIVISGSVDEMEICKRVCSGTCSLNLSGKINLKELKFVVKNALLCICNDSMALHMASALKTPCAAIFCSTIPEFGYGPWKNKSIVVEKKLSCRPCGRHGHNKCPEKTEECMKISSDEVISASEKLLA